MEEEKWDECIKLLVPCRWRNDAEDGKAVARTLELAVQLHSKMKDKLEKDEKDGMPKAKLDALREKRKTMLQLTGVMLNDMTPARVEKALNTVWESHNERAQLFRDAVRYECNHLLANECAPLPRGLTSVRHTPCAATRQIAIHQEIHVTVTLARRAMQRFLNHRWLGPLIEQLITGRTRSKDKLVSRKTSRCSRIMSLIFFFAIILPVNLSLLVLVSLFPPLAKRIPATLKSWGFNSALLLYWSDIYLLKVPVVK